MEEEAKTRELELGSFGIGRGARPGGASRADGLVEAISRLAGLDGPDAASFAGVAHLHTGLKLYATDTQAAKRLLAQAQSDAGNFTTTVAVVEVRNSHRAMIATQDRIVADIEVLRGEGIELGHWGPDYHKNCVVVAVASADLRTAARVLSERYGPSMVTIVRGGKFMAQGDDPAPP